MSRTLTRLVVGTVAAALAISPAAAIGGTKGGSKKDKLETGRMTGGGNVYGKSLGETVKVTHGFELHCRTATRPQRLQVNWSGGNSFHLTNLTDSWCRDEGYDQENPSAPFDTYYGEGSGRLHFDGEMGTGTATWRFVDDGEPGTTDRIRLVIKDSSGRTVLTVTDKVLRHGNHQAHRSTGSKA